MSDFTLNLYGLYMQYSTFDSHIVTIKIKFNCMIPSECHKIDVRTDQPIFMEINL